MNSGTPVSSSARIYGLAGLLSQAFAVFIVLFMDNLGGFAVANGFYYAALIFSFLCGVWWGLALDKPARPRWIYGAAVAPSLIALALYLARLWAWPSPQLPLAVLGVAIMASPLVDRAIARHLTLPAGWLHLRWQSSLGLGGLTLMLALA